MLFGNDSTFGFQRWSLREREKEKERTNNRRKRGNNRKPGYTDMLLHNLMRKVCLARKIRVYWPLLTPTGEATARNPDI